MEHNVIAEGIGLFAQHAGAKLSKAGDVLYEIVFPVGRYPALIGIELFGMTKRYGTYCFELPNPSVAPTLLRNNWGGIDGTCFYLSVHVRDGQAWLVLETKQLLDSSVTPESIASLLGLCRSQCTQATGAIATAFGIR